MLARRSDAERVTKPFLIAPVVVASLLATGCYCPMLSGRYCEVGCYPPCPMPPPTPVAANDSTSKAELACAPHRCCLLNGLFGLDGSARLGGGLGLAQRASQVPSQQGPDYLSPQASFHPVPTHPVFEPQLAYSPPQPIESAGSNPLRPKGSGVFGGGVFISKAERSSARGSRPLLAQEPKPAASPPLDR